jgi:hypothetical protein
MASSMWVRVFLLSCNVSLSAQNIASFEPKLEPGEGLAVVTRDREVKLYGEAKREFPMGSLAKLVWLKLEGVDWSSRDVRYNCKGADGNVHCWLRTGHGRVDLGKALQESCNLAFLAWSRQSTERWKQEIGEGAARAQLESAFGPFLGRRLPTGDTLPEMTQVWVGDGDLLRTSPQAMAEWLADPSQYEVLVRAKRFLGGWWNEILDKRGTWWFKTGTAPVLGDPTATAAWTAGSDGSTIAVLHLPRGRGKVEGIRRFKEVMGLPIK